MSVPTVNIIMTYRPSVMMKFQRTGSLQAFIDDQEERSEKERRAKNQTRSPGEKVASQKHTYIFRNTPNSNLLSLTHSFNEEDKAVMEVELLDPEGVFEEAMIDNSVGGA